jgi:hypothetical protein
MNIKILGHNYLLSFSGNVYHETQTTGEIKYFNQVINIDSNSHLEYQEETLLHEIFEALRNAFDHTGNMSHEILTQFSEGLYCVIKDNPHIFTIRLPEKEE